MPFRDNSNLYTGAIVHNEDADGVSNSIFGTEGESDVFIFATGSTGDDNILGFNRNDSLISHSAIFDGNKDGIITLGNEVLDIDRTSAKNPGSDQIGLVRDDDSLITDLRYLGTKDGKDFVYADADTRFALDAYNGAVKVTEGTVANNTLSGAGGKFDFLYDTALGLNLGGDTIKSFGSDDRIVTTVELFDGDHDGKITFGTNGVLDLAGETTGRNVGPGGQLTFDSPAVTALKLVDQTEISGVHYYFYGDAAILSA